MVDNDPSITFDERRAKQMKEMRHNPCHLANKTKEMKRTKSLVLHSDDKIANTTTTKMCDSTVQGPRIILKHFTKVRGIHIGELVTQTHFNTLEVCLLLEMFSCLAQKNSKPYKMTQFLEHSVLRQFLVEDFGITNETALYRMVNTIAKGKTRTSPKDFVKSLSIILRGNLMEKAEFVFRTFDKDNNGLLTKAGEFVQHMTDMYNVQISAENPTADPDQPKRDTIEYLLKKFDRKKKGEIAFEDFFQTIQEEPLLMECCFSVFPSEEILNTFQTIYLTEVHSQSVYSKHQK